MKSILIGLFIFVAASFAQAKLNVVATTADIAALVTVVAGDNIHLSQIAKGSQDPHYIEAKPSFMVKMRDADLVITNGLSLEVGWLPTLIKGARNPKISAGSKGYLDLGSLITPIEKPMGSITRAMGDVHPEGNPHFTLDPVRRSELALKIADKLSDLDNTNKEVYQTNAKKYQEAITKKMADWLVRIKASGVKTVVTYHPSMNYFMDRFELKVPIHLEAKPGIPPSAQHILSVIDTVKKENTKLILVDSFFDTKIADRIVKEAPKTKAVSVGIAVNSLPQLKTLEDVTEQLVKAIESAK
ncbi:MAG: metal ABC transporter substrate-binding protein [Pseudobdellovibrio sp.]|nr:metal ABC transporter substrate-binding protein [Pseudobdellovibrio sp.]